MSDFDKWWEENCMILSSDRTEAEDIYNLGMESQQAKIDKLKSDNQLSESQIGQACAKWKEIAEKRQAEIDELRGLFESVVGGDMKTIQRLESVIDENNVDIKELQARVDGALNMLCKLQYSSGERIYGEVGSILKGNKDEN